MSIITIQFGQCGNQLGRNLFSSLSEDMHTNWKADYFAASLDVWFDTVRSEQDVKYARAVLVDTEHKVVDSIYKRHCGAEHCWQYKKKNIAISSGGGAGNNWALGYCRKGKQLEDSILDIIRLEAEECDRVSTFLNLMSTAGGTGSGVGSFVSERLNDEFSSKLMMNAVVLPYESGEVVTQNYNSLLTLAKLYDVSDLLLLFGNDNLHKMCVSLFDSKAITFDLLNNLISMKIGGVFQPIADSSSHVTDIAAHLTPHPAYKLVTVKSAPHVRLSSEGEYKCKWDSLLKHTKEILRVNASDDGPDWELKLPTALLKKYSIRQYAFCAANAVITRGPGCVDFEAHTTEFSDPSIYPGWIPSDSRLYHGHNSKKFMGMDKFVTLATNNNLVHDPVNVITMKAWDAFKHGAYLHHYSKYGLELDDFNHSFATMETVIKSYKDLHK